MLDLEDGHDTDHGFDADSLDGIKENQEEDEEDEEDR